MFFGIPHQFHTQLAIISRRFHNDFKQEPRAARRQFSKCTLAPPRFHNDLTFLPRGARRKYSHPHRDNLRDNPRDNPAHGAAGAAAGGGEEEAQTASGTPSCRDNLSPARSFASPRPHARHARHEPKPKSISRLGPLRSHPPTSKTQISIIRTPLRRRTVSPV